MNKIWLDLSAVTTIKNIKHVNGNKAEFKNKCYEQGSTMRDLKIPCFNEVK